jgi:hypothetical protein
MEELPRAALGDVEQPRENRLSSARERVPLDFSPPLREVGISAARSADFDPDHVERALMPASR